MLILIHSHSPAYFPVHTMCVNSRIDIEFEIHLSEMKTPSERHTIFNGNGTQRASQQLEVELNNQRLQWKIIVITDSHFGNQDTYVYA